MEFNQSKTYRNIISAYERELSVSTLYNIFADRAAYDGFIEISQIYDQIARNEKEHARIFLRKLNNGEVPPTTTNLAESSNFEVEASKLYRDYARTAQEEGFTDLAALFNGLVNIEQNHSLIFQSNLNDIYQNQVFCKPQATLWICMQCGNIMSGECAPEVCPVCDFPQGYYRLFS